MSDTFEIEQCGQCKYFTPNAGTADRGSCRIDPPLPDASDTAHYPIVCRAGQSCSRGKRKVLTEVKKDPTRVGHEKGESDGEAK